jgi:cell division protein ZipA
MQDELRITLFAIGAAFIVGILLHGAWTIRKNKKLDKPNSFQPRRGEPKFEVDEFDDQDEDDTYDDVGVGQARVISVGQSTKPSYFGNNDASNNDEDRSFSVSSSAPADSDVLDIDVNDNDIEESKITESELDADLISPRAAAEALAPELEKQPATAPIYSGVVTQPKPEFNRPARSNDLSNETPVVPDPPGFLLKKAESLPEAAQEQAREQSIKSAEQKEAAAPKLAPAPDFSLDVQEGPVKAAEPNKVHEDDVKPKGVEKELSFAEQAKRFVRRNKKTVAEKIRKEPQMRGGAKASEDQMRMDFAATEPTILDEIGTQTESTRSEHAASNASDARKDSQQTDVLVLNVRASPDNPISGAALLPMLLTLGFKFGDHDIFHRHVNTNGKGPILFSLTNLFKPGVFDIDNMETFSTQGVSLFMMLPIEGEAQQVFNMMHNAARKIAEEFGCKILDGNRVLLSKQSLQQYSERIRDFERRRLTR